MACVVVFMTAKDEAEALLIARSLVEKKLAACCNLVKGVRSIYRWQGKVEDDAEVLVVIKTREECVSALEAEVKRLHSYSVPEIIALPVTAGSAPYLNWIAESTI